MAGGRMHTFHPTPLDPTLVISYRNHQKSVAYFSHLAPLVLKAQMAEWYTASVSWDVDSGLIPSRVKPMT